MSKNRYFKSMNKSHKNNEIKNSGAGNEEIFDNVEAAEDNNSTQQIEDADVEALENEQAEESVDAKDETVLPEDNIAEKLKLAEEALEKEKKEYLFLMADFDNFRKRVVKEKADLIKNASEKVLKDILPIVDDFERGLEASKNSEDAQSLREGMELIYNKLVKFLSDHGVKAMDTNAADFDAEVHEAIATLPTNDENQKGKIIDTTQKGYMLNDKVLRHAKVVVGE